MDLLKDKYNVTNLTTYDLVKSLAILLTVLDHVGYYFHPENDWFRILGRSCVPIWCFLVGYARSRDLGKEMWGWAIIIQLSNFIFGGMLLPFNMLFTILAVRLVIDKIAKTTFKNGEVMMYSTLALCLFIVPTMVMVEYGTAALLLALCGYAMRHQSELPVSVTTQRLFFLFCVMFFALYQILIFGFVGLEAKVCAFLIGATSLMMFFFKPKEFPGWPSHLPLITGMFQFAGRYTLEIYAIHILLFKAIAAYYAIDGYGWFQWDILMRPEAHPVPPPELLGPTP